MAQEPVQVERSNNKVILDGTVYYIHQVKPGETLYAISQAYHISQKEIAIENPGVISGLQIGQTLKIPVDPKLKEEVECSRNNSLKGGPTAYRPGRPCMGSPGTMACEKRNSGKPTRESPLRTFSPVRFSGFP